MRITHFACWLSFGLAACATTPATPPSATGDGLPPRLSATAESPMGIVGFPAPCGVTVAGNTPDLHFRIDLRGRQAGVRAQGSAQVFNLDGLKVEVSTVLGRDMSPAAAGLTGLDLLRTHARWEAARASEALGREIGPEELEILTSDTMPAALLWWLPSASPGASAGGSNGTPAAPNGAANEGYVSEAERTAPRPPSGPTGVVYLTAAYDHRVLALSVQGSQGEARADLVAKAKAWMATLATSPDPVPTNQIDEDARAALAAGRGCESQADGAGGPGRPEGAQAGEAGATEPRSP